MRGGEFAERRDDAAEEDLRPHEMKWALNGGGGRNRAFEERFRLGVFPLIVVDLTLPDLNLGLTLHVRRHLVEAFNLIVSGETLLRPALVHFDDTQVQVGGGKLVVDGNCALEALTGVGQLHRCLLRASEVDPCPGVGRTALDQPLIALNGVVQVALDEEADSTDAETIVGRQHVLVGKPLREL